MLKSRYFSQNIGNFDLWRSLAGVENKNFEVARARPVRVAPKGRALPLEKILGAPLPPVYARASLTAKSIPSK